MWRHPICSRHWQLSELAARQQVFELSIETDQMLALMDGGGGKPGIGHGVGAYRLVRTQFAQRLGSWGQV